MAEALVSGENEKETTFFLQSLKNWLPKPVKFMTIDFSSRIESGVKEVFPEVITQKCVFHAIQLLLRGLIKELTRIKNEHLMAHIKEWSQLSRLSIRLEKDLEEAPKLNLAFKDTSHAWKIYQGLRNCIVKDSIEEIEWRLSQFFLNSSFREWKGNLIFLQKYDDIFIRRKLKFSEKGLKYIIPKIYKAWRGAIREERIHLEVMKLKFNKIKYLLLMNPQNMASFHINKLRKYLKIFPWLRPYRKIIVRFYYQFRLPVQKKHGFQFLTQLLSEKSHPLLKSAISTLISNEEQVFQFKQVYKSNPRIKSIKSIKVVNESNNKILNQLFQTQCGMRTIENIRMRISHRLKCPIIISPNFLESS